MGSVASSVASHREAATDRDRENLRLEPGAVARLAGHARHERADAIARKLALRLFVKPLHLRNETFEWPRGLRRAPVRSEIHLDRLVARSVIGRLLKRLRQHGEGHR